MSVETLIQTAVVCVDMALVAAWHILRIALPAMVVLVAITGRHRLRRGR